MKSGDRYRDVVEELFKELHPDADVTYTLVKGPDGLRDIDVAIRRFIAGKKHLTGVECKDHIDPIGIEYIDAWDSKRDDIEADLAMICSNSGFTGPALRKADRKKIGMISALMSGDPAVRGPIREIQVNQYLDVANVRLECTVRCHTDCKIPDDLDGRDVTFKGLPLANWLRDQIHILALDHRKCKHITATYSLRPNSHFSLGAQEVQPLRMVLSFDISWGWLRHAVIADADLAFYDHQSKAFILPPQRTAMFGVDLHNAKRLKKHKRRPGEQIPSPQYPASAAETITIALISSIEVVPGKEPPPIDDIVESVTIEAT